MAKLSIDEIVTAVSELTVLEVSQLVKAFEEKFGVTAAAPVAAAAAGVRRRRRRRSSSSRRFGGSPRGRWGGAHSKVCQSSQVQRQGRRQWRCADQALPQVRRQNR